MMKNKKIIILLFSLIIFPLVLLVIVFMIKVESYSQFRLKFLEYNPESQPNTTWVSEDKKIKIVVDETCYAKIYFEEVKTQNELNFSCGIPETAYIHVIVEDVVDYESNLGELYETWKFIEVEEDKFTVVVKETRFFKIGDRIKFYKVFDGSKNNEPQGETQLVSSLQRRQENRPLVSQYTSNCMFFRKFYDPTKELLV